VGGAFVEVGDVGRREIAVAGFGGQVKLPDAFEPRYLVQSLVGINAPPLLTPLFMIATRGLSAAKVAGSAASGPP